MIRAVLFDMDGLMFDTERLATETWMELGRRHGIPVTRELMDETRGRPLEDCVRIFKKHLGQEFDFFKHRGERKRYMDAYLEQHGLPVKPGLGRLLGYLRENGYKTALATSTHEEIAGAYLKMAGVEEYFDCKVFGNMVERGKPNPEASGDSAGGMSGAGGFPLRSLRGLEGRLPRDHGSRSGRAVPGGFGARRCLCAVPE